MQKSKGMALKILSHNIILLLSLILFSPFALSEPSPEAAALLAFKSGFVLPNPDPLSVWSPNSKNPPCPPSHQWPFLLCANNLLVGIRLVNLSLSGTINIAPLAQIKSLRSISLENNNFSGPIPSFSKLDSLKSLYLSNNSFSGNIPDDFFSEMDHLKKLWLDGNTFTGPIPSSITKTGNLFQLHLENNQFSGALPDINISSLSELDVSSNKLVGAIPDALAKKFGATSFAGNPDLCGPPLDTPCSANGATGGDKSLQPEEGEGKSMVLVILGVLLILGLVVGLAVTKNRVQDDNFDGFSIEADTEAVEAAAAIETSQKQMGVAGGDSGGSSHGTQKRGGSNRGPKKGGGGGGGGDLVMVNEEKGEFGVADLMKASAEVLGNGGLGSAYKVAMPNGAALAVKRMREMNKAGKEEFDGVMRRFGSMRHRNVLPPLAYLYRREEKLIVSEYINKGSLLYILHGDRGQDHAALTWPARLKIIRGLARGMSFLHSELSNFVEVPHGNLKSGNILLASDFEPLIVDYGFLNLVNPPQAPNALFAFKSPEAQQGRGMSPKSDVYCLGIVILEILTGKFPSQYLNTTKGGTDVVKWTAAAVNEKREVELLDPDILNAKNPVEDMVKLLRVGASCIGENPEERPEMKEVEEVADDMARRCGIGEGEELQKQGSKMMRIESQNQRSSMKKTESTAQRNGE